MIWLLLENFWWLLENWKKCVDGKANYLFLYFTRFSQCVATCEDSSPKQRTKSGLPAHVCGGFRPGSNGVWTLL